MSDRMEDLMDEEAEKVSEMTDAELEARHAAGRPAQVRKREDFSQRMHRVMEETIARSENDEPAFVLHVTMRQSTLRAQDMAVFTPVTEAHRG
jgi:broad specificity phosphatase PhoE